MYMLDFGIDFSVALRSILEVMYSIHIYTECNILHINVIYYSYCFLCFYV
jgi:hypothetical protein